MHYRPKAEVPRKIKGAAERELVRAVQPIGSKETRGVIIVDGGIDEVSIQRRADIARQGVRDNQVRSFKPLERVVHVGTERGVKCVQHRTAGGEQHLVHAEVRVLAWKCRAWTWEAPANSAVGAGVKAIVGEVLDCRRA